MKEMTPETLREIHLIPYCHPDYAWTNLRAWHISRYLESYRQMLSLMDEHPEYTSVLDNIVHSLTPFLRYCPERFDALRRRVREGRVDICTGGWSLARPTQVPEETFIRNLAEGDREFRRLFGEDLDITTYFNADTAMGHSQLPQLVRLMGYRNYQFQRPENFLNLRGVPKQFRWRGLDGSEILCARGCYGGFADGAYLRPGCTMPWAERRAGYLREELSDHLRLQPTAIQQQFQGMDDMLPLTNRVDEPLDFFGFAADWNRHEPSRMEFSTLSRFFRALEREELPILEGCVDPSDVTFNLPAKGERSLWRLRAEIGALLVRMEALCVILSRNGGVYPGQALSSMWHELFEITGHAMEAILEPDHRRMFPAATGLLLRAREFAAARMEELSDLVGCGREDEYVAANPNGFAVVAPVTLTVTSARGVRRFSLADSRGNAVPFQRTDAVCGDKAYTSFCYSSVDVAAKVSLPAFGCEIVRVVWEDAPLDWLAPEEKRYLCVCAPALRDTSMDCVLTAGGLTAEFRGGALRALTRDGAREDVPVFRLRCLRAPVSDTWIFDCTGGEELFFNPASARLVLNGPLLYVYEVRGMVGESPAVIRYTLGQVPGLLTVETEIENREPNALYAADFACDPAESLRADIPFGWEARPVSALPDAPVLDAYEVTLPGQLYAKSWVGFTRGGTPAAALQCNCATYWQYRAGEGCVSLLLSRSMDHETPDYDRLNDWVRHDPPEFAMAGTHSFSFALSAGETSEAALCRASLLLRTPLAVGRSWNCCAHAPAEPIFTPLDGAEVAVTALYKEGDAVILRLYECAGTGGVLRAQCAPEISKAVQTDLRGVPLRERPVSGGALTIPLRPFEIVTLRLSACSWDGTAAP